MKEKNSRLETLKLLISSQEIGCQEDLLKALAIEGVHITQATLSRDLKQLKVAKAASINGKYTYVLPNETMYKRVPSPRTAREMMKVSGFLSVAYSGNMGVMKTRPGYASSIAYNIDNGGIEQILGTISGNDTIFIAFKEPYDKDEMTQRMQNVISQM